MPSPNAMLRPFIALMVDETTDKSNQEQLTVVIRWVSDEFEVSKELLGVHHMQSIDALSIVNVIKDILLRFQSPFAKLRGQCYDVRAESLLDNYENIQILWERACDSGTNSEMKARKLEELKVK